MDFDETNDKLTKAMTTLEEAEKNFKNAEEEVCLYIFLEDLGLWETSPLQNFHLILVILL